MPTGSGSAIGAETIVNLFEQNAMRLESRPALRWRAGPAWETLDWSSYARAVHEVTAGLVELGLQPADRAGILSGNRPFWHVADLGILTGGGVSVPVYPTSVAAQAAYVLDHAEVRICFVDTSEQVAKLASAPLPRLEHIVALDMSDAVSDRRVISFARLKELGASRLARDPSVVSARSRAVTPDDLATLVYTSGTTGSPKGAMLTHGNITWTLTSLTQIAPLRDNERFLSFLPLSHIAERMVSHFMQVYAGAETWFARSLTTVAEDLRDCRPTIFFAVPRVYEKAQTAIQEQISNQRGAKRALAERFLTLGARNVAASEGGAPLGGLDTALHRFLDRVVGAKIRHGLGLDQARFVFSGAAPIDPDLLRWFHALGLPVAEVYGQTEGCGPTTLNPPERIKIGTVGRPIPGLDLRLAPDGEILVRGGNVCQGYFHDPDGTALLLDGDGWMHSGDLGQLDASGYLRITGRKKDIIITAGGKNIAPQAIEGRLKLDPLISEAVVIGDARPYLAALVTLDAEAAQRFLAARGRTVEADGLAGDPDVVAAVAAAVERVNTESSRAEGIKRWRVLPRDLTIEDGELTPTLKLRRQAVLERHREVIAELYADAVSLEQS